MLLWWLTLHHKRCGSCFSWSWNIPEILSLTLWMSLLCLNTLNALASVSVAFTNSFHISVLFSIRSILPNSQLTSHGNDPHCSTPGSISAAFRKALYETSFSHLSTLIHWVAKENDLPLDARETRQDWQEMMWYNHQCGFMDIRVDKCVHYQYGCHISNIWTSCQSVPSLLVWASGLWCCTLPSFSLKTPVLPTAPSADTPALVSLKTLEDDMCRVWALVLCFLFRLSW